ncbi:MAG: GIY-YIG nuclease family protein [Deltaproteobacteria bacterium]|nr:GIY-YIG nuclease family protein [Deltaproteobacteria bacterium]
MKLEPWNVYILKCADGTLYTGVTKDLKRRLSEHNTGKAARYTRGRGPVKLVYQEKCKSRSVALVREYAVKALPREKKKLLIKYTAPPPSR